MQRYNRRSFLTTLAASGTAAFGGSLLSRGAVGAEPRRKFTMDLVCGRIGVRGGLQDTLRWAQKYGFESLGPAVPQLTQLSDTEREALQAELKKRHLVLGAVGLPVDFRKDDATFRTGLERLTDAAGGLQRAGATRVGTWLSPGHNSLTYMANFKQHRDRLRQVAKVLDDHGLRLGLEYVGPKTSWTRSRHAFIHTMAETKELIAEIGQSNVGLVLDSWHWYTAHESKDDLLTLTNEDVVACDLNDAPANIEVDEQIDNRRELPAATGVIDLKAFLSALVEIGYDGPVRAEPFNAPLNEMNDEDALAATAAAMKKAFAWIE